MKKEDLVKALNEIQLLLQLSDVGMKQLHNNGSVENRIIVCEAVFKLLGRPMSKEEKAKLKKDLREYEIWCCAVMCKAVEGFENVCSNIIFNPELLNDYPPLFGEVFVLVGQLQNRYLEKAQNLEQVASILSLCEKYIPDSELEYLLGVFLIEEQCYDELAKIPRLKKYFEAEPVEPETDLMYVNLLGGMSNGGVN